MRRKRINLVRRFGVALHRGGHFIHGGGGLLHIGGRLFGTTAQLVVAVGDSVTGAEDVNRLTANVIHQPAKHQAELADGAQRHSDFINALHLFDLMAGTGRHA